MLGSPRVQGAVADVPYPAAAMDPAGTARSSRLIWPRLACVTPQPPTDPAPADLEGSRPQILPEPRLGVSPDGGEPDPLVGMVAGVRRELLYLEEAHTEVVARLRKGAAAEVGRILEAARAEAAAMLESARLVAAATTRDTARVDAG